MHVLRINAQDLAFVAGLLLLGTSGPVRSAENVVLLDVPDYTWHAGCFGTGTGNLMGFWDRNGLPDFYTGPVGGGVAPLDSSGGNVGIRLMWASHAHTNDYWVGYESAAPDPYRMAGRSEHEPDCLGDFIGLSQNKWTNLNNECDGNIDAYCVAYWDANGSKRINYIPPPEQGQPVRDIPSGLRAWTEFRGHGANSFSQLTDFNPETPAGQGFTFADLKAEIDAGYPVLLFLQNTNQMSRALGGMPRANPLIHAFLAYGYFVNDTGRQYVRYKNSWGSSGVNSLAEWGPAYWYPNLALNVRGVIGYHPMPTITSITRTNGSVTVKWDGPSARLAQMSGSTPGPGTNVHFYVLERAPSLEAGFAPVSDPTPEREIILEDCCEKTAFFRVRLLAP